MKRKCNENCPGDETCPHNAVCMCGNSMGHSPWEGHQPTSMHDYYCEEIPGAYDAAMAREHGPDLNRDR